MTKKERDFVKHVKSECTKYGVKLYLKRSKQLKLSNNMKCSGYFDENEPAIVCAINRKDWLEILVHEYGHLTQWAEGTEIWKKSNTALSKVDEWLEGTEIRGIKKHLAICRDLELDNEKRSVKIIKKFKLTINIDSYIRKANAYVQFYNHLYYTRTWIDPNNSPYTNNKVIMAMSKNFNMNYSQMSKRIQKVYEENQI